MRRHNLSGVFVLSLLFLAAIVFGQGFTGPGSNNNSQGQAVTLNRHVTIAEARILPNDSWVILTGNIINMLPGGRQYTFRDQTGEIAVDIGPKEWRGLSVVASDSVEIYGEVKIQRGQTHIKVQAVSGAGKINLRQGQSSAITHHITVNEARALAHDSWIVLRGNIINKLADGKHNYTFCDSSGEITVDIGPKEWRGLSVGVSDSVEIYGEVKISRGQISIKVHAIQVTGV